MWTHSVIYNLMCLSMVAFGHNFRNFDDSVRFEINWPGKANADLLETQTNVEPYYITTANKERYQCLIVNNVNNAQNSNEPYDGPNPIEILSGLFIENSCSHRLDPYWSYELCHGRYVRQYHENRDGKKVKTQEYYLGTFDKLQILKLFTEYAERKANPAKKKDIPVKKINGVNMPYVEIEMGNGTICDLTNKPRKIKVLYICYPHGTHELSSVEEPVSCEYEVIVASSWLCNHPDYKQAMGENEINCHPVDNAPKKPRALVAMEMESLQLRYLRDDKQQKVYAIFRVDNEDQAGDSRVRVEILPAGAIEKQSNNNIEDSMNSITDHAISPAEISPVKSFLSGKNCLHGGNGWWKYEFCYGRSVVQYHVERDGKKTLVNLGNFDKQKHLDWIAAHPHKKTKSPELRKQLSHFYSDGTVCDKTGNPRQTEVKLKCIENHSTSPFSVSLFLLEPKTCEYVLGVESPLICDILEYADENGLLSEKFEVNFDKLKTTAFHEYDDLDERIANGDD